MLDIIKKHRFIAILRNVPLEKAEKTVRALYDGGIRIFEVTFTPSKSDTIETVTKTFDLIKKLGNDVSLCAGTVVCEDFVRAAKESGAGCIVSPHSDEKIIKLTKELGMISIPGAFTPTEIMNAYNWGADIVKIFPILPDNIAYLKNVISPLSHIPFITTGGVRLDTAKAFLDCGAVALAAGATVITPNCLANDDYEGIKKNAEAFVNICRI